MKQSTSVRTAVTVTMKTSKCNQNQETSRNKKQIKTRGGVLPKKIDALFPLQISTSTSTMNQYEKVANAVFYEKVFRNLNEGGMWCGKDSGFEEMCMRKGNDRWWCELQTYVMLKEIVPVEWLNKRVVLFYGMELETMRKEVFLGIAANAPKPKKDNHTMVNAEWTAAK